MRSFKPWSISETLQFHILYLNSQTWQCFQIETVQIQMVRIAKLPSQSELQNRTFCCILQTTFASRSHAAESAQSVHTTSVIPPSWHCISGGISTLDYRRIVRNIRVRTHILNCSLKSFSLFLCLSLLISARQCALLDCSVCVLSRVHLLHFLLLSESVCRLPCFEEDTHHPRPMLVNCCYHTSTVHRDNCPIFVVSNISSGVCAKHLLPYHHTVFSVAALSPT